MFTLGRRNGARVTGTYPFPNNKEFFMRKKILFFFALVFLSSFSLYSLDLETSVTYQPSIFTKTMFPDGNYDVAYGPGQQIIYQAGLNFRSGFNFGFGIKYDSGYDINDNLVGKAADVMGYLGFKYFTVKISHLSIPGKATFISIGNNPWDIQPADGQPEIREFESKKTSVELLLDLSGLLSEGEYVNFFYVGLYYAYSVYPKYTSFKKDITNWYGGQSGGQFYHTERTAQTYGVVCGIDGFSYMINHQEDENIALNGWFEGWFVLGFGTAVEKVLYFNPEKERNDMALDYYFKTTLGLMVVIGEKMKFAIGVGYMLEGPIEPGILLHVLNIRAGIKI
jgi:hypothetical protein